MPPSTVVLVKIAAIMLALLACFATVSASRKSNSSLYDLLTNRVHQIERAQASSESISTAMVPSPIPPTAFNPAPSAQTLRHQAEKVPQRVWSHLGESKSRYVSNTPLALA